MGYFLFSVVIFGTDLATLGENLVASPIYSNQELLTSVSVKSLITLSFYHLYHLGIRFTKIKRVSI